jgi:nicotine blue oxidoreductase
VVLAAGGASRFGAAKQVARLGGRPLLQHVLDAAAQLDEVVLVVGARADEVLAAVRPGGARVVRCPDWEEGMAASLRAGLAALDADWSVVLLADQPRIGPEAVARVASAARTAPGAITAVRGAYGGRPSHPVALGRPLAGAAAALRGDAGARALLDPAATLLVEVGDVADDTDVDTPAALDALQGSRG